MLIKSINIFGTPLMIFWNIVPWPSVRTSTSADLFFLTELSTVKIQVSHRDGLIKHWLIFVKGTQLNLNLIWNFEANF